MSLVLEVFWGCTWTGHKSLKFSNCSNLISPEFQQSGQLQNYITPKPYIASRRSNNRWKYKKVLYNSCICLYVRFPSEQSQLCTYWLLLTVKLDSTSVPKILFWRFLGGFEDTHMSWYFHGMMWCLSYVRDCSFRKTGLIYMSISLKLESRWITLKPPWTLWIDLQIPQVHCPSKDTGLCHPLSLVP
jgi:hypothetical protein